MYLFLADFRAERITRVFKSVSNMYTPIHFTTISRMSSLAGAGSGLGSAPD